MSDREEDQAISDSLLRQLKRRANEKERRRLRAAHAGSFSAFAEYFFPISAAGVPIIWDLPTRAICQHIDGVLKGRIRRLLVNVPPGFAKSLLVNVLYPAYVWGPGGQPQKDILALSSTEDLALRDAAQMRDLINTPEYQSLYGDKVQLKTEAVASFSNTAGGVRRSRPITGATGLRGDIIIVDDANGTGVDSKSERAKILTAWRESAFSRAHDPLSVIFIVIQQRTHADDLSGELLNGSYRFEHLCLSMRFDPDRACRTSIGFVDPRTEPGQLLSPERYPEEVVKDYENNAGSFAVAAHYQQNPQPRDGVLFKREWFAEAVEVPQRIKRRARAYDLAASENGDWTVGLKGALGEDGIVYVEGMLRCRKLPGTRDEKIVETAKADGSSCTVRFAQDPSQAGKSQIDSLRRQLSFVPNFKSKPVIRDKVDRAREALRLAEQGKLVLLPFAGRDILLDELCAFPHGGRGVHDDCVDALSDLVDELVTGSAYELTDEVINGLWRITQRLGGDSLEAYAMRTYRG